MARAPPEKRNESTNTESETSTAPSSLQSAESARWNGGTRHEETVQQEHGIGDVDRAVGIGVATLEGLGQSPAPLTTRVPAPPLRRTGLKLAPI